MYWKYTTILHKERIQMGLSLNEYAVADYIARRYYTNSGIQECLGLGKQTVIDIVNRLIEDGFAERSDSGVVMKMKWFDSAYGTESGPLGTESGPPEARNLGDTIVSIKNKNKPEIGISVEAKEEEEEDVTISYNLDGEGEEIVPRGFARRAKSPMRVNKNTVAIGLVNAFNEMAQKEIGTKRETGKGDYFRVVAALKLGLTEKQIKDLFFDWFNSPGKDEEKINLTFALSYNNINKFKVRENL